MTDSGISSTGLCSSHSAYLRPNVARGWGCAAHTRSRSGLGGTGALSPPIRQTCRVSARSGLSSLQAASSRQIEELQIIEIQRENQCQQRQQLGSGALRIVAAIAAAASCLHAAPALADTAVQGAEQIAKSLSSSNGALGSLGTEPFREGLVSGFLLILFSELGDKTFFIAVLLALKKNKGLVFAGTFGALAVMTVISVVLGQALHQVDELLPSSSLPFDDIAAAVLLVFFGIRTLQEAGQADTASVEEEREAQEEVERLDSGAATGLLLSTFALVFAAEWGDKSFLATIALSAASSPVGVVTGAVAGHGVATLIAVLGGSVLGQYLNEKVVQYVGGSLFLVFAGATTFDIIKGLSG